MGIGTRRLILVIVSIAAGIGLTFGLLLFLDSQYGDVNFERFGVEYFVLTALPLAVLVGIWLDFFLKTNLLSDGPADAAPPAAETKSE
jgi:hypothetical protein